jgi:hypothetical protein
MKIKINKRAKWRFPEVPLKIQYEYYKDFMEYTSQVAKVFEEEIFPVVESESKKNEATDSELTPVDLAFQRFLKRAASLSRAKVNKAATKMIAGVEVFQRNLFVDNIKKAMGVDIDAIV